MKQKMETKIENVLFEFDNWKKKRGADYLIQNGRINIDWDIEIWR